MKPLNIALSILALMLAVVVFLIHFPTKNLALLLLTSTAALTQVTLLIGALQTTPFGSSSIGCEIQAFFINAFGFGLYACCACLAIDLWRRTTAVVVIRSDRVETVRLKALYFGIAVACPTALTVVAVAVRTSRSFYINNGYCDWTNARISFVLIYVVSLMIFTVIGSVYTVLSVMTYYSKRKNILKTLHASTRHTTTTATAATPTPFSPTTPTSAAASFSLPTFYTSSVVHSTSNSYTPTTPTATSILLPAPAQLSDNATPGIQPSHAPTTLLRSGSGHVRGNQSHHNELLHALHRMLAWCVGYHVLATLYLIQNVYAVVKDFMSTPASSWANTIAPTDAPSQAAVDSAESRAETVMYATALVAVLLFACFGTGKAGLDKIRAVGRWVGAVLRLDRLGIGRGEVDRSQRNVLSGEGCQTKRVSGFRREKLTRGENGEAAGRKKRGWSILGENKKKVQDPEVVSVASSRKSRQNQRDEFDEFPAGGAGKGWKYRDEFVGAASGLPMQALAPHPSHGAQKAINPNANLPIALPERVDSLNFVNPSLPAQGASARNDIDPTAPPKPIPARLIVQHLQAQTRGSFDGGIRPSPRA